ncbi:hypothetical protein B0H13DRAFT_2329673 [Mycena leptocephala]|nr:hypothetical protein B0H13DRAFT_2359119 [Mycena leptocephala]KAJ7910133.1 hypothetical protein B0H13DRAFT_2329673 [Mycena leptocephala]
MVLARDLGPPQWSVLKAQRPAPLPNDIPRHTPAALRAGASSWSSIPIPMSGSPLHRMPFIRRPASQSIIAALPSQQCSTSRTIALYFGLLACTPTLRLHASLLPSLSSFYPAPPFLRFLMRQ